MPGRTILSLFIDDGAKPSKLGRQTLAGMLGKMTSTSCLEILAMDLLTACEKAEVMEALSGITEILSTPEFAEITSA